MKRLWFTLFSLLIIATVALTACGPKATPVATAAPATPAPATEVPTVPATAAPAVTSAACGYLENLGRRHPHADPAVAGSSIPQGQ